VVSWKKTGDRVARGERIGLVRFGSRADVWVPRDAEILVKLGDNLKGGSSVLAMWPQKKRTGPPMDTRNSGADLNASVAGKQT
jgi:hypothetical protein